MQRWTGQQPDTFFQTFWALQNVSLKIEKGKVVGIVGRNGSGKSTLLQIICGLLSPTLGYATTNGRVAALLELGAGFNPEFTGRENVYLNASLLGLSRKEIDSRFPEIAAFADIGDFIDRPVKTYSSGMFVRLAFAVQASVDPTVLVVDEALAVGDVKFQAKCFRRFESLIDRGTTILFVSHSVEQVVRHCDRAVLLDSGRIIADGDPKAVTHVYLDLVFGSDPSGKSALNSAEPPSEGALFVHDHDSSKALALTNYFEMRAGYNSEEYRWGNRDAEILDFLVSSEGSPHSNQLRSGRNLGISMRVRFKKSIARPIYGIQFKTPDGIVIYSENSRDFQGGPVWLAKSAGEHAQVSFECVPNLSAGEYLLSLGVAAEISGEVIPLDRRFDSVVLVISNPSRAVGLVDFRAQISVL